MPSSRAITVKEVYQEEAAIMKYSTKLSDAVHIMVFIELSEQIKLTSTEIAVSNQTNPAMSGS